ncbi:dihydroorotate dehydrogenase (quinone) [Helicobacter saguini]|uniref:Dihydroorotate dehydrogenase (quinone) n=1 Tax=Helicobacter saguini TaxID=1548018 RepID=A0A347VQ53_9HELI|nr:dihydroorotate dehydrogenase (quinone) [Helicobacter saguini]MWV61072.1 dihydroorotate dehydrogenase (quinone) [Helicobacter saguini]MWV68259.1 dihydroorotate dehydrogenase (quinone) [Helicobacter saguini]MWV70277.1 dihydroorotate dehydrogenase (quinone) [Helicobacter saguini]MWV72179.1 dihydroorotate dehydrogenase (quinone) [Helicobacter saguini]TLD95238.1 dihydroorotate dehydrogenase (quinone) [Helicobacter saguini]
MNLYKQIAPLLYKMDAESAHEIAVKMMKIPQNFPLIESSIAKNHCVINETLSQNINGLRFYNPLGLASGFDKNAELVRPLSAMGFGFLELGSVTQMAQAGNPKPRIFRHIKENSLQNAMGFNNIGARGMLANLKNCYPFVVPLGINIGKNKLVAQVDSLTNYELSLQTLEGFGDYFVFNLSSPNTPNLRDLQNVEFVSELLKMAKNNTQKPLFIKISPDMEVDSMLAVVESAINSGASGIVATNTTIDYGVVATPNVRDGVPFGGISGAALREKSREVLRILGQHFFGKITLISVGGISSSDDVWERLKLGASLVQLFTALIYEGPSLIKKINKELAIKCKKEGVKNISEIVGSGIVKNL